jgi:hypothetical protein
VDFQLNNNINAGVGNLESALVENHPLGLQQNVYLCKGIQGCVNTTSGFQPSSRIFRLKMTSAKIDINVVYIVIYLSMTGTHLHFPN